MLQDEWHSDSVVSVTRCATDVIYGHLDSADAAAPPQPGQRPVFVVAVLLFVRRRLGVIECRRCSQISN